MNTWFARRMPDRIGTQITLLILAANLFLYVGVVAIFLIERHQSRVRLGAEPAVTAALVRILDREAAGEDRTRILREFNDAFPTASFDISAQPGDPDSTTSEAVLQLRAELGQEHPMHVAGRPRVEGVPLVRVTVRLRDGTFVSGNLAPPPRQLFDPWLLPVLVVLATTLTLGLWAARQLTRPLHSFAEAAERYGLDGSPQEVPETGPREIRTLARALNGMQARISRLVAERTQMLASVGHDLRTPITRLKLRTEFVDSEMAETMLRDLDQMTAMVDSALAFLRNEHGVHDQRITADLASLVQTVCDEFSDMGKDVSYQGPDHLSASLRPSDMHRALTNLVDNATTYGTQALISLSREGNMAAISVEDDGPGIPDGAAERMTEPFIRGDEARNLNGPGGFGLGLSVVRRVAESHGGRLVLANRPDTRGLRASIVIPVAGITPAA